MVYTLYNLQVLHKHVTMVTYFGEIKLKNILFECFDVTNQLKCHLQHLYHGNVTAFIKYIVLGCTLFRSLISSGIKKKKC